MFHVRDEDRTNNAGSATESGFVAVAEGWFVVDHEDGKEQRAPKIMNETGDVDGNRKPMVSCLLVANPRTDVRPGSNVAVPSGMSSLAASDANQRSLKSRRTQNGSDWFDHVHLIWFTTHEDPVSNITSKDTGGVPTAIDPK
jgi:hypothetical protein